MTKLLDPMTAILAAPWEIEWDRLEGTESEKIDEMLVAAQDFFSLPFKPHLKQLQVEMHPARGADNPILYGGGMRGGKSSLLCGHSIGLARRVPAPGICLLGRFHLSAFRDTTLKTLQALAPTSGPQREFEHNQSSHEFTHLKTGFVIKYGQMGREEDLQRLGSSEFVWIGIDEAPEVPRAVFEMLQTRLSHQLGFKYDTRAIWLTGNPNPGWIKQDFIKKPKDGYHFIRALVMDNPYVPSSYVDEQRRAMTPERFAAWMLGDWDAFIPEFTMLPPDLVREALKRTEEPDTYDCSWGVDPGYTGNDPTAVWSRMGIVFRRVSGWPKLLTDETVDKLIALYEMPPFGQPRPRQINVDRDGLGAGVYDQLLRAQHEGRLPKYPDLWVCGVNAQGRPTDDQVIDNPMRYSNIKSENFMKLRMLLEEGRGDIEDDEDVFADLTTPTYDTPLGKIQIEKKETVKQRLGRSPNDGDALLLTIYTGRKDEIAGRTLRKQDEELSDYERERMRIDRMNQESRERFNRSLENLFGQVGPTPATGRKKNPRDVLGY